ncbi:hypothetical protein HMPREF1984_00700 [Leptotrichia sp. oral taxon 215 str. W9775]|nr:hypothetical protein HMPREF1984_00700 [Leptotrichia sp. oral taxon 215 str. W9775]
MIKILLLCANIMKKSIKNIIKTCFFSFKKVQYILSDNKIIK